jgi:hypothetical protein
VQLFGLDIGDEQLTARPVQEVRGTNGRRHDAAVATAACVHGRVFPGAVEHGGHAHRGGLHDGHAVGVIQAGVDVEERALQHRRHLSTAIARGD